MHGTGGDDGTDDGTDNGDDDTDDGGGEEPVPGADVLGIPDELLEPAVDFHTDD